jgi:hypothetical protein
MPPKEIKRNKNPKTGSRGSPPRGLEKPSRRKGRDFRNVDDSEAILSQELVLLSEEPRFIDGLKQIAQVHLGGMPDYLVKLAASIAGDLAIAYESLGVRTKKTASQSKKR